MGTPIEPGPPILNQFFQVVQVAAIVPAGAGDLIGPPGVGKPLAQVFQDAVLDGDGKRFNLHVCFLLEILADVSNWVNR